MKKSNEWFMFNFLQIFDYLLTDARIRFKVAIVDATFDRMTKSKELVKVFVLKSEEKKNQ